MADTRVAMRLVSFIGPDGGVGVDRYNNRAVAILELRWGKLVVWEDYEDTERTAAWDRTSCDLQRATSSA